MPRRCCHGKCNTDERYPDRLVGGVRFIPFPKPKSNHDKCTRWIKQCCRPQDKFNIHRITQNTYICSKHFMNGQGPTVEYPDPLPYTTFTAVTKSPTREIKFTSQGGSLLASEEPVVGENDICYERNSFTQTEGQWVEPLDMIALAMEGNGRTKEVEDLKTQLKKERIQAMIMLTEEKENRRKDVEELKRQLKEERKKKLKEPIYVFSVDIVKMNENKFKYYTSFSFETFKNIHNFLVPNNECPLNYVSHGNEICKLSYENQVFLTLCKLRHNFEFNDLSFRFGISKQACSSLFKSWINYMVCRFGEISIWPHRDVLSLHMPEDFKNDFPNTFAIIDCTEIKIEKPASLKAQSQTYSEYKSANTFKGLVAVDPRGSVIFSSMLFAGSISDKDIFTKSGFQGVLEKLIEIGHLNLGDGLIANEGFNIEAEVDKLGLKLNILSFAKTGKQMSEDDVIAAAKITKQRVHVERAIKRIKQFDIISNEIALTLFSSVNQIWYTCCFLTNFMPACIRYKD